MPQTKQGGLQKGGLLRIKVFFFLYRLPSYLCSHAHSEDIYLTRGISLSFGEKRRGLACLGGGVCNELQLPVCFFVSRICSWGIMRGSFSVFKRFFYSVFNSLTFYFYFLCIYLFVWFWWGLYSYSRNVRLGISKARLNCGV